MQLSSTSAFRHVAASELAVAWPRLPGSSSFSRLGPTLSPAYGTRPSFLCEDLPSECFLFLLFELERRSKDACDARVGCRESFVPLPLHPPHHNEGISITHRTLAHLDLDRRSIPLARVCLPIHSHGPVRTCEFTNGLTWEGRGSHGPFVDRRKTV